MTRLRSFSYRRRGFVFFACFPRGFDIIVQARGRHAQVAFWPRARWVTAGVWKIAACGAADCDNACRRCVEHR